MDLVSVSVEDDKYDNNIVMFCTIETLFYSRIMVIILNPNKTLNSHKVATRVMALGTNNGRRGASRERAQTLGTIPGPTQSALRLCRARASKAHCLC